MQNLLQHLSLSLSRITPATPSFKTLPIADSGCQVQCFTARKELPVNKSSQSNAFYTAEWEEAAITYGLVVVHYEGSGVAGAEAYFLLDAFLQKIQRAFSIACATGSLCEEAGAANSGTISLTDYWQDSEGTDWKAKGWTNGSSLALLYLKNIGAADSRVHDVFLDSFRFAA